ncbi:MAG: DUF3987 domain-containing protein [Bacteroidaceae bacterium]|nr:DUF3987 domain-containing protein [Bacteroidaceae bacterium]
MSCYSITYRNGHKVAVPVTREEYIQIRNSSRNIANLNMARKGSQPAKRALAQFCYSCYPNTDGTLKGATKPSATVAMDIDHVEDAMGMAKQIAERANELEIYMIERTASGKGLHVVFRRIASMTNEENIRRMAEALHVEADLNAKDITRVLFSTTAHERELYLLRDELFADNGRDVSMGRVESTLRQVGGKVTDDYKGIPYSKIIDTWWKLFYNGETPTQNNRNTLTFELAVNMRHICGYSEAQLRHIIPCYDGFSEEERNECIASAVSSRKTMMPYRMTQLLNYLKQQNVADVETVADLEESNESDRMYENQLPALPLGLRESVAQAGPGLVFPAIFSVGTIAGFYATRIQLGVHGVYRGLSLQSFIVGESGSGKSACTRIFKAWTAKTQREIDEFYDKEQAWAKRAQAKLSGTREKAPESNVRIIPLNNTSANVAERLEAIKGVHSISYVSEADVVFGKWKSDMDTLSSMLRTAWDEDRYDREAKSAEAARCHIPKLLWNTLICGTPDALYRLVSNVTDGFMNRLCIARTPDNTFTAYETGSEVGFRDHERDTIAFIVDCLSLMQGKFYNDDFEQWNLEWMETMRIEALKQGADKVLARMRMRTSITSARQTMASYILLRTIEKMLNFYRSREAVLDALKEDGECWIAFAHRCVDDDTRQFYLTMTDYMVDNFMYYFGEELAEAYNDKKYNRTGSVSMGMQRKRKVNIFDMLGCEFGYEDIMQLYVEHKHKSINRQSAWNMISRWKQQGLITDTGTKGLYAKVLPDTPEPNEKEEDEV